jgi:putative colanic acid biosynthesis acetyltransferase WcaF
MQKTDLSKYNNRDFQPGGTLKRSLWYLINLFFFSTAIPFPSSIKSNLLTLFGATVGNAVVIKPSVNIKYPWFLEIGDNAWIGENVWIDNLARIKIGKNVVLSQGAYLLTGSHDYTRQDFRLMTGQIILEEGVWIAAKATVCPGVTCKSHSILSVSSVATHDLSPYTLYQGNPATEKRKRKLQEIAT